MKKIKKIALIIALLCAFPMQQTQAIIIDSTIEACLLVAIALFFYKDYQQTERLLECKKERHANMLAKSKQMFRKNRLIYELIIACENEETEAVKNLITQGADPYKKTPTCLGDNATPSAYKRMKKIKNPTEKQLGIITILEQSKHKKL